MPNVREILDRLCVEAKLNGTVTSVAASAVIREDNSGASFTDETSDASSATGGDVTIPDPFDASDALYIGYSRTFNRFAIDVSVAGVGDAVAAETAWEYFNGFEWTALTVSATSPETAILTLAGVNTLSFTMPTDWRATTVNSQGAYYYIRFRATANDVYNTTQPTIGRVFLEDTPADRRLALGWLQEAADRACGDAQVPVTSEASVSLTQGDATYTLNASPFPTDMVALLDVAVSDSALELAPVVYITPHEMQGRRQGGSSVAEGTPFEYSGDWPNIVVWPPPGASTTLTITYLANAPTLADTSTAITTIPASMVWGCWYELAMWRALQYKKQLKEADSRYAAYIADKNAGLPALRRWVGSAMARQGPVRPRIMSPVYSTSQDLGF